MIIPKASTLLATLLVGGLATLRSAADSFGYFSYLDEGSSITITDCIDNASGALVVPSLINGKPVTAIGEGAFSGCSKITSVTLPDTVTSLGESAFHSCSSLASINLPEGITSLGETCFFKCAKLKSIHIPSTITSNHRPFYNSGVERATVAAGATAIPGSLFKWSYKLEEITLPDSVTSIGSYAFSETVLREIKLPKNLTTLGKGSFLACREMEQIRLPSGIKEIPALAFANCERMKNPVFPEGLTHIGSLAFASCRFDRISFPSNIRDIGKGAFKDCQGLRAVVFTGKAPAVEGRVFTGIDPDFAIFLQKETKGFTLPRWKGYRTTQPRPEIAVTSPEASDLTTRKDLGNGSNQKFPAGIVGRKDSYRTFIIHNSGTLPLTNLTATIQTGDSRDFIIKPLKKTTIAAGKSITLKVRFAPTDTGKRRSELRIGSNDANENPYTIGLSATGVTKN